MTASPPATDPRGLRGRGCKSRGSEATRYQKKNIAGSRAAMFFGGLRFRLSLARRPKHLFGLFAGGFGARGRNLCHLVAEALQRLSGVVGGQALGLSCRGDLAGDMFDRTGRSFESARRNLPDRLLHP